MKKKTAGIIFDFDGTLCNSQKFIYESFCFALATHNLPFPPWEEFLETCQGMALVESYQALTGMEHVDDICNTHRIFQNEHAHKIGLFPNVRETLTEIKRMGIRMAIATNRGDAVHETLDRAHIGMFFETVRDVKNTLGQLPKPHPQMLFDALEYMRIDPSQAIMVGDMQQDMEAGKAARMSKVVAVSYGFTGKRIVEHNPDHMIHDMRELLEILNT